MLRRTAVVLVLLVAACGGEGPSSAADCSALAQVWAEGDQSAEAFAEDVIERAAELAVLATERGSPTEAEICQRTATAARTVIEPEAAAATPTTTAALSTTTSSIPAPTTSSTTTTSTTSASTTTTTQPPTPEFFAWMPGGLDEEFIAAVATVAGVESTTTLSTATMHITSSRTAAGEVVDDPPDGFVIPVGGLILADDAAEAFLGTPLELGAGDIALGESSARLRRLGVGDFITFETGVEMRVAAIIPDAVTTSYEVFASNPDAFVASRIETRAALVRFDGIEAQLEAALADQLGADAEFAVRERRSSPDRGPRVVRSQVFIKETFGEFAYRPLGNGRFDIDPQWVAANIVEVDIPLLGRTRCHRLFAEILTDVMNRLIESDMADVIDPSTFAGCFNARYIRGTTRLSRHSFGAAADINFWNPPDDRPGSPTHPELLRLMYEAGVTSGHVWTRPDPGHFEYYGIPIEP